MRRILHVTAEVAPFSKTGGLGDVLAGLPKAQRARGDHAVVLSPRYGFISLADKHIERRLTVHLDATTFETTIYRDASGAHLFLDAPGLLDRPTPYGAGGGYDDNPLRFGVLCKAAATLGLDYDLVELHDWQAGLAAVYLAGRRPVIQTVHNLRYQGLCAMSWADRLEVPGTLRGFDGLEYHGDLSLLKGGLSLADALTTVSPSYAHEIQEEPGGQGLSGLFRHRANVLHGLLNGLDASFSPTTDPALPAQFSAADLSGKAICKAALRARFGLGDGPLFAFVGRAAEQKGLDLMAGALDRLVAAGGTFVALTDGDPSLMRTLRSAVSRHPGRAGLEAAFDPALAQQIYGGADFIVVPSRFEPCGLAQLIAMAYGAVPVVRRTGGLADTVVDGETGLTFFDPTADELARALGRAVELFAHPAEYLRIQDNGLHKDSGWGAAAAARDALYDRLL